MDIVNLLRRISWAVLAAALLSATAFPLSVSACHTPNAQAKPCCCSKPEAPTESHHRCHCPKPAGSLPGNGCTIQRTLPGAVLPSAALPSIDAGYLFVLPVSGLSMSEPLPTPRFLLRIEPGWDPGNQGFLIPLRL